MVTRSNIAECYRKYRVNMEQEESLRENSLRAQDQESWIERLRQNMQIRRQLYVENEALLNLYIRPFLTGELRLTDSLAEEFLKQILDYHHEGYDDEVLCVDVAYLLESYFTQNGNREGFLWIAHYLGNVLNTYDTAESYKKSLEYFDLVRGGIKDYFSIEDWELRRMILFAYYNYPVVLVNCRKVVEDGESVQVQKRLGKEIARAAEVYDNPEVRALDGERYDLDGLKKELLHDVYGNWVCGMEGNESLEGAFAEEADAALTELYCQELAQNPDPYAMEDTIYCNYWKCQYACGKISLKEFFERYMGYCKHIREHESLNSEDFINTNYYHVCMYDLPNALDQTEGLPEEEKSAVQSYCVEAFRDFVRELPKTRSATYVNVAIIDTLCQILPYLPKELFDFRFLMDITVNRDPATMIHSVVVQQLSMTCLHAILDRKPELLVGVFGTSDVLEVLEKRGEFEHYVGEAALVHDIGKIGLTTIVSHQIRRLNEREWERLRKHPSIGNRLAEHAFCMRPYRDVILGHHKSYDGQTGYPEEYDNTSSPVRILTDLIRICDCMEAATDSVGRSYKNAKSIDEFMAELAAGSGRLYNPELVAFLRENTALLDDLRYICTAGKNRVYYAVYSDFISDREEKQKETAELGTKEQESILMSLARASMAIFQISLKTDRLKLLYRGPGDWFADVSTGSFRRFIGEYLRGKVTEESWQRLKQLLSYGVLTDKLLEADGMFELEIQLSSGAETRWVRMQFILAEQEYSVPVSVTLAVQDIEEARRRREQVRTALELAYQQTKQANQAKSMFLSSMSHDIRTPMNAILGMTQIAAMNMDDRAKVEDCLTKIRSASSHLLELINQVLDMSRIESGKIELEEKPVSLRGLIRDMLVMTQSEAQKKQLHVQTQLEGLENDLVYGDSSRIQQIFLNLMSNAVKYTPADGEIVFTARTLPEKTGGYSAYEFVFRDNGIGMTPEFLEKIFDPFSREETERTAKIQGTGLGMSITKTLANMMRGDVTVESAVGKGSCFTVTLRLREAKGQTAQPQSELREPETGSFQNCRILLVEDNEINREIIREFLKPTEILVDEAENGKAAVECIAAHPGDYYQLVFMDIQMPLMNGYEAAAAIRDLERDSGAHVPILALTANAFSEDIDRATAAGMDGYLSKPVEIQKIMEALRRWLPPGR